MIPRFLSFKFCGSPEVTRLRSDLLRAYRPVYSSESQKEGHSDAKTMIEFTDIAGKHYISNLSADEIDDLLLEFRESDAVLACGT